MSKVGIDRIGVLEVLACLACDFGLYTVVTRLQRIGFRGRPTLRSGTLEPWQWELYRKLQKRAAATDPYDPSGKLARV